MMSESIEQVEAPINLGDGEIPIYVGVREVLTERIPAESEKTKFWRDSNESTPGLGRCLSDQSRRNSPERSFEEIPLEIRVEQNSEEILPIKIKNSCLFNCCSVSHKVLFIEAILIWFAGFIACADLSSNLFLEVWKNNHDVSMISIGLSVGFIGGILQGYFLFRILAHRNLDRIIKLENPQIWNCYRIQFYIFFCMFDITLLILSKYLVKENIGKIIFATIDMIVAISLGLSLYVYYQYWPKFFM